MAATVTKADQIIDAHLGGGSRGGNGFHKNGGGHSGDGGDGFHYSPARYRIGAWMAVGSILMLFVALTSAYIVRSASSNDWRPIAMPKILWLSTALILISSVTIEVARKALRRGIESTFKQWMTITTALGVLFLAGQIEAFRQLTAAGFYLSSNPHTSYAYVLTGLHGLHLMGGVLALLYVMIRARWSWAAISRNVSFRSM